MLSLHRSIAKFWPRSPSPPESRRRAVTPSSMDADLQDQPEVVLDMVARWKDGYEVVYGRAARIFFGPPLHSH